MTRQRQDKQPDNGKRTNAADWVRGAFTLTRPVDFVDSIVCIDDCDACPLFKRGCAGKCSRWDDLVCASCPCLGSKYNDRAEISTVDPDTFEPQAPDKRLLDIRAQRKKLLDGQPVQLRHNGEGGGITDGQ